MAVVRYAYAGAAVETTIAAAITAVSGTCELVLATGWPAGAPFPVVMEAGTGGEEKALATRSGVTLTFVQRGFDGTAAQAHPGGSTIYPCITAVEIDSFNRLVSTPVAKGDILVADANGILQRIPAGGAGTFLGADVTQTLGVAWMIPLPVGTVIPTAAEVLAAGWLWCDGSAVSRATFAALFTAIGTKWGAGDGTSTFNLPDLRGRFPVGANNMQGTPPTGNGRVTAAALGLAGGEANHTLAVNEMPAHAHTGTTDGQSADHSHTINHDHPAFNSYGFNTNHQHWIGGQVSIAAAGDHAHNYVQMGAPNVLVGGGNATGTPFTGVTAGAGAHGHSISGWVDPANTDHVHTIDIPNFGGSSGGVSNGHTHTFTSVAQGGSNAHNVTPPYAGLNFWIKAV